jgi:hypothetical protein
MPPRQSFKPDASFFKKIAIGAIGARAVCSDLGSYEHSMAELERGSTDSKMWKEVKRKRVRIPDLVCTRCGLRVESRAKTKAEITMSHSPTDAERHWSFGMIDDDLIAFPICGATEESWSTGKLEASSSYWHERNWVNWRVIGKINYFTAHSLQSVPPSRTNTKGVTEGSETAIAWDATFSNRIGTVTRIDERGIQIRRASDGHSYTWRVKDTQAIQVGVGDEVTTNQVIASPVVALRDTELRCAGVLPPEHLQHLLRSRERTQRFTGVKLARLRGEADHRAVIEELTNDREEDVYVRLEGVTYLASVCRLSAHTLFRSYLESTDQQIQLEAVIALGETATDEAVELLTAILNDNQRPYFLRSAAAWSLSRIGGDNSIERLVLAFSDVEQSIREEALEGVVSIGGAALPILLTGVRGTGDIAAGCAEALRQQGTLPDDTIEQLVRELRSDNPSHWVVWLVGHLPREYVAARIAELQDSAPPLHFAISVLWSFVESWISKHWELNPRRNVQQRNTAHAV